MLEGINRNEVTVQDCIDMYEEKGMYTILDGGRVAGFVEREDMD